MPSRWWGKEGTIVPMAVIASDVGRTTDIELRNNIVFSRDVHEYKLEKTSYSEGNVDPSLRGSAEFADSDSKGFSGEATNQNCFGEPPHRNTNRLTIKQRKKKRAYSRRRAESKPPSPKAGRGCHHETPVVIGRQHDPDRQTNISKKDAINRLNTPKPTRSGPTTKTPTSEKPHNQRIDCTILSHHTNITDDHQPEPQTEHNLNLPPHTFRPRCRMPNTASQPTTPQGAGVHSPSTYHSSVRKWPNPHNHHQYPGERFALYTSADSRQA
ncbi:hypothetical protein GOP47_0030200 [Adiantum capillus-veneris]|nr:hypothetical protein GOP47_0030200 [Adiantum capillus-veneris]